MCEIELGGVGLDYIGEGEGEGGGTEHVEVKNKNNVKINIEVCVTKKGRPIQK